MTALILSIPAVLILAVIAYWNEHNQWFTLLLVVVILGSGGYVIKTHHDAYGEWLPSPVSANVETSGTATLNTGGQERHIRLPVFDDARSGYVSAKAPSDWIALQPTADADVVQAETGRFLFVRKSFRVNLRTGEVTALTVKSEN